MKRANSSRPWRPAPLVWLSLALLAAAAAALAVRPALWPWALAALAADLLLLTAAVFWPRGRLLGANLTRLPPDLAARGAVSLTFDDGPDPELTPRVLDLLDRYHAKASFFCVAEKAVAHAELTREIVRRGHSVENHSLRHSATFALYGPFRLGRDVASAQALIAEAAGRTPAFFRAPAGMRSVLLDPVLARCGLHYVSWTRRGLDGVDGNAARVLRRLAGALAAGDILLLHDNRPVVLEVLPKLLQALDSKGLKAVALTDALVDGAAV